MKKLAGLLIAAVCLAGVAEAADRTIPVKFKAGSSFRTVRGVLKGYDTVTYVLGAYAGQNMQVLFSPSNPSCYFNVNAPNDGGYAIYNGSNEGNEFAQQLEEDGKYRVMLYLYRNAARRNETCRYSLTFSIRD